MVSTEAELAGLFEAYEYKIGQRPAGLQARLLVELLDIYHRAGLLPDGKNKPLCRICPNRRPCWDGGSQYLRKSPPAGNGGICLPWDGRDYRPGRDVVIVAINPNISPNDSSDLLIEHGITWDHHIVGLALNARAYEHSRFAYGSMRSAAALLDVADGVVVRDREPHELAGLGEACRAASGHQVHSDDAHQRAAAQHVVALPGLPLGRRARRASPPVRRRARRRAALGALAA